MYNYQEIRPRIFTEEGQTTFLAIRDKAFALCATAGAVRADKLMVGVGGGDSWTLIACMDRLLELKELREIAQDGVKVAGQDRIFVRTRES